MAGHSILGRCKAPGWMLWRGSTHLPCQLVGKRRFALSLTGAAGM